MAGKGAAFHAQQMLLTRGRPMSSRAAGRAFYRDALEHIAIINQVRILAVGLPTNRPIEVYHLWFWLAYALLVEKRRAPRPKLPLFRNASLTLSGARSGSSVVRSTGTACFTHSSRWPISWQAQRDTRLSNASRRVTGTTSTSWAELKKPAGRSMLQPERLRNSRSFRGATRAEAVGVTPCSLRSWSACPRSLTTTQWPAARGAAVG